jgi:hypothetical protein
MDTQLARRPSQQQDPVRRDGALSSGLLVTRDSTRTRLQVMGRLTELTRRHLDDWLDWLATQDTTEVTVTVPAADQIDIPLLQILRIARIRLRESGAALIVTALTPPPDPRPASALGRAR